MTRTSNRWQRQFSGPERAFLFEAISSDLGRSLLVPLVFSSVIFSTGFLFPSQQYLGISVHVLDLIVLPATLTIFLLVKLLKPFRSRGLFNGLVWVVAGIAAASAPNIALLIITGRTSPELISQLPVGVVAYSLLISVTAVITSGWRLSRTRLKNLRDHKTLLNQIREELQHQIDLMRGEIKQSVDLELAKALDVLKESKNSKDLAERLFAAIDDVIRPLSHRLAGLGVKVLPPRQLKVDGLLVPNKRGVALARLSAPEIFFLFFLVFILPASFFVQGLQGLLVAFGLLIVEVALLVALEAKAKGIFVSRIVGMASLALMSAFVGSVYSLLVTQGYDSGISVGFVTTSLAVTGLMSLVSKRIDDLNQLAIVNQEMQGVIAVLRQEAWVTKSQLAKAIHGSVQAKFLAVALRIANSAKVSNADLAAARKDIEASLDDVAGSLEGRTDSFAKQFKTIADAWDGVAKLKLKADKETIALINKFPVARTCVLEVIGEAVSNAAKHSKAPTMDIELQENSLGQVVVSVWSAGKLAENGGRKGYGSQMLDEVTSSWSLTNLKGRVYLRAVIQVAK